MSTPTLALLTAFLIVFGAGLIWFGLRLMLRPSDDESDDDRLNRMGW